VELAGRKVIVVGLAQTGVSVARFCAGRGAQVVVTDAGSPEKLAARIEQLGPTGVKLDGGGRIELELAGHRVESFTSADLIVMSPGVPDLAENVAARAAGVEVMAEIELAYRLFDPGAELIAITGTNGKSTTTALSGALCAASGRPTFCGGNLGNMPLIDAVDHPANRPGGLIVAEVAAFMLEQCATFRPKVAVLTNITEDHLDRFGTMEVYASMKGRIFDHQLSEDVAVANAGDSWTVREATDVRARLHWFDSRVAVDRGAFVSADRTEIVLRPDWGPEERYPVADLPIIGNHNLENAMCAYLAARAVGVPIAAVRDGARGYQPLKHRMEHIADKEGIAYFDDSKGTNVDAVAASLRGFPRPVILIAGGVDKGGSYRPMFEALDGVARGLVLIGKAAPLIRAAAEAHGVGYPVVDAGDMVDAVAQATALAQPGWAVVLSPACASYDMFKNFGERGMAFREASTAAGATRRDG
jgi:UDP-N-acetylmuramoylalanine--D-glutamate ligase